MSSSPMHAFIIGIDEYPALPRHQQLRAAVADAIAMESYVVSSGSATIYKLHNGQATRIAILDGFEKLIRNGSIRWNDPVVIYFAGHGMSFKRPEGWHKDLWDDDVVQAILPSDYDVAMGRLPIPDRTINAYLWRLACVKGNNITLILDCCHSGTAMHATGGRIVDGRARGIEREGVLPPDLDRSLLSEFHSIGIPSVNPSSRSISHFASPSLYSHVRLAACGPNEQAMEDDKRGVFTSALLKILNTTTHITYDALIDQLPLLHRQNPQCEGGYVSRGVFDRHTSYSWRTTYRVEDDSGRYVLRAGSLCGISTETMFEIYPGGVPQTRGHAACTLSVRDVQPGLTVLNPPPFGIGRPLCALQLCTGEECMRLCVAPGALMLLCEGIADKMNSEKNVPRVEFWERNGADLEIFLQPSDINGEMQQIVFNNLWSSKYGTEHMPVTCPFTFQDLMRVLRVASHFFWNLRREPQQSRLNRYISLELHELALATDIGCQIFPVLTPTGCDLISENVAHIAVDTAKYYGIKINNSTGRRLHIYLYYFDGSSFSIVPFYETGRSQSDSNPSGPLLVGYGRGGGIPINFNLQDGQDMEVGFLKLFVSTERADMHAIQQRSPFGGTPRAACLKEFDYNLPGIWDTIVIPIVLSSPLEVKNGAR